LNLGRSSADRQSGTFSSVTWTAQDLQVLSRGAAAHSDGNDVVELKLRLGAALSAPATIPHPDHLLNIVGITSRRRAWSCGCMPIAAIAWARSMRPRFRCCSETSKA